MCEQKLTRHKWADVLIALAEGRDVQWRTEGGKHWTDVEAFSALESINRSCIEWRVKPKIVRKYCYAYEAKNGLRNVTPPYYLNDEDFVDRNYVDKIVWFQRLDNSCVEMEEV